MSKHICRFGFFVLLSNSYSMLLCAASSLDEFAALDRMIKVGNLSKIKTVVSKDKSKVFGMRDAFGNSLLHRTAAYDQINIAEFLMGIGADKDPINKKGYTPLDVALIGYRERFITCMVNAGADKNRALGVAVERDCPKAVTLLVSLGADPSGKGPDGDTLLEHARICESNKVISLLTSLTSSV